MVYGKPIAANPKELRDEIDNIYVDLARRAESTSEGRFRRAPNQDIPSVHPSRKFIDLCFLFSLSIMHVM